MSYNLTLAYLAVAFGWLAYTIENRFIKCIVGIFWLLMIPNTIYILTDIQHLPRQFAVFDSVLLQVLLLFQYALLFIVSIIAFVLALYPFEKTLTKLPKQYKKIPVFLMLIAMNFLIAYGVVLGRIQRTNSWEVFTNPGKVIQDGLQIIYSPLLLTWVFFFGLLSLTLYIFCKTAIVRISGKIVRFLGKKGIIT